MRPIPEEHVTHLVGLLVTVVKKDRRRRGDRQPFTHSNLKELLEALEKALKELEM